MRSDSFGAEFVKAFVIFMAGGFIYGLIEVIYRGHTHPSMFVLGGICLLWIERAAGLTGRRVPLAVRMAAGGMFITAAEFVCGLIINVWLGLRVWDYSKLPMNILGQVCPMFFVAWALLSVPAAIVGGLLRSAMCRRSDSGIPQGNTL